MKFIQTGNGIILNLDKVDCLFGEKAFQEKLRKALAYRKMLPE